MAYLWSEKLNNLVPRQRIQIIDHQALGPDALLHSGIFVFGFLETLKSHHSFDRVKLFSQLGSRTLSHRELITL